MLHKKWQKSFWTRKESFLRNLAILGSGTALAQLIPILASPLLTRIYSPNDFGMFAVFMALISTFTPLVCGKYEVALVLPRDDVHAEHLFGIAIYFSLAVSGGIVAIFLLFGDDVLSFLDADKLGNWVFAVPLALLLTGFFTASNYLANRNRQYILMSHARVSRSLATTFTGILAGTLGAGFGGLLAGVIVGLLVASLILLHRNQKILKRRTFVWSRAKHLLFGKYRHYLIYNASTGLLNGLTLSLPVFFLSRYFPESIVGYYAIVLRVTLAPVGFISASVSQINLKKVIDLVNADRPVMPYLLKLTGALLLIIAIPALIVILWGFELFALVFGESWATAGEYASIMMPAIAIQFVASTLSTTLEATQHNRLLSLWRLISIVSTMVIWLVYAPKQQIITVLWAATINNGIIYSLYFLFIVYAACNSKKPSISIENS